MSGVDYPNFIDEIFLDNAKAYLHALLRSYGLTNAAYVAHMVPGRLPSDRIVWTTYSDEPLLHRDGVSRSNIDPFLAIEKTSLLPIDLAPCPNMREHVRSLFGEAAEVGKQALIVPVHGPRGDRSFLIITSNEDDADWEATKRRLMPDLVLVVQYIHHKAMVEAGLYNSRGSNVKLTPREVECLQWAAAGKTARDIATILSISQRVTRGHLDEARHKLNASNVAHAVGRAVSLGLVSSA
jgi:DNA-binding CsgD family transcriptional regulator